MKFREEADPYQIKEETLPVIHWRNAEGVIIGRVGNRLIYRPSGQKGNLILFGLPGDGKTFGSIIPTALQFGGSVLAIDIKGDIYEQTKGYRRIKLFSPAEPNVSCHFDPFASLILTDMARCVLQIESMAISLLPDEKDTKDGKYFTSGGRDFFCGITAYMLETKPSSTFIDVVDAILQGNPIDWIKTVVKSECHTARTFLASKVGENERNLAGCYSAIASVLRPFSNGYMRELLNPDGDCISASTLEKGWDIYIKVPVQDIKVYAPLTTLITQSIMDELYNRPDVSTGVHARPIIMLLDELPFQNFDKDKLTQALSTLRSKGVTLYLAMQSFSQLEDKYGENAARQIVDTCAYISIVSAQDPKNREYFASLVGSKKVLKKSNTYGEHGSVTITEDRDRVFQPEDFGNLNDHIVIIANGKYIKADKIKSYVDLAKNS